jgi:hypothetical protein
MQSLAQGRHWLLVRAGRGVRVKGGVRCVRKRFLFSVLFFVTLLT